VLDVGEVNVWWPHTHGSQPLYQPLVCINCDESEVVVRLGSIGFRRIERTGPPGVGFGLRVNGVPVFCRGAVWTPLDVKRLDVEQNAYEKALKLVKAAGFNLLRVAGITTYESDLFYQLCDEYGILVWQDFMFANFDYPVEDPAFVQSCRREAESFLGRTETRVSLAVLCGNSEMQQQAAMMGLEADAWSSTLFDAVLPEVCKARRPDLLYVVSSPSGGDLPFHVDRGPGHYYGVGAYQRPLEDVYAAGVRFASECLAFAQPPELSELRRLFGDDPVDTTDSRYRDGVQRDPGANWDFSDVTSHYVGTIFGAPARALATTNADRYLELARVSTGRVMAHVFGIWRRADDPCEGGVVFTLRDVMPGPGWGLISNTGIPKSSYYFLKRILAPRAMWFVDGGVNGLRVHVANDTASVLSGRLTLRLCRDDGRVIEEAALDIAVASHAQSAFGFDRCLGRFTDANRAYRFGPAEHSVVTAALHGAFPLQAHFVPNPGCEPPLRGDLGLSAEMIRTGEHSARVILRSKFLAEAVALNVPGYIPSDNYVDVLGGEPFSIELTALGSGVPPVGTVKAMNGVAPVAIVSNSAPAQGNST
jgi:beta-mannosidase